MRALKLCLLFLVCLAAPQDLSAAGTVTYLAGPNFCSTAPGYPDLPYCTIPGEIPLGSWAVPAPGGIYIDPNFGGLVRILTGAPYVHVYSQPSPVSAHSRYVAIRGRDTGSTSILNFATGHFDYAGLPAGGVRVWDAFDDDIQYRIEGTRIIRSVFSSTQETVLVDYSQTGEQFTSISVGAGTDTSKDNWLGFYAPDQHKICTVDLNTVRTYCADYMSAEATSRVGWDWLESVMVSKGVDRTSGRRYVLLMGGPAMGMWSVNLTTGKLDFETRGPDNYESGSNKDTYCDPNENCLAAPHADTMEDSDGKQYLVTAKGMESPCGLQMVTMDLSKGRYMYWPASAGGGLKTVFNVSNCGDPWPEFDLGCAKNAAACVLTLYRDSWRNPADLTTPIPSEPHRDQIVLMRGNGQDLKVLGVTRSVTFADDSYWPQSRSALSPDGQYVVFDSNFGVDGGNRVAILSTAPPTDLVKAVSVAPAIVSGNTQTLTLTYSDIAGASDLTTASLWIKATAASPSANSCLIVYDRAAGMLKLADDSGNGWLSMVPGAAGTMQNTQCSVSGAGVAVTLSSNNLVLSIPLTLKAAYGGVKQVWISATGNAGTSGWQQLGSWTVPAPVVTNTSVTPSSGSGAIQTFTAVFNDTAGAFDIASAYVGISANTSGANSCFVAWTRATGLFKLLDDNNSPSASSQNSQCSVDLASARATDGGNGLTLSVPVTFKPAFVGAKGIWMMASGSVAGSSLQQLGTWSVPGAVVTNTSITPSAGSGDVQTFTAVWTDTAGSANLTSASLWIKANAAAGAAGSCSITWTRATNQFKLLDDSGAPSLSAQNSQCSLAVASARATDSGNTLTLTLPVTFLRAFGGVKGLFMSASGTPNGSVWQQLGSWTVPAAVLTNTSVAPNAGAGASAAFTAVWTDTAGVADVTSLSFRITPGGSAAASGCNVVWTASTNQFRLLDDAGAVSSAGQNSQCSLSTAWASAVASGNTVTLTLPVSFKPAFGGTKELWMSGAGNLAGSAWQKLGAWTVSVPVVAAVSASPASGQGSVQRFALTYSDSVGAQDLASTWFWFTSNFNATAGHTCFGYYERASNQIKLLNDQGSLWTSATRGSTGAVENSQCAIDMGSAAIDANGNSMTLSLTVTFKAAFAGTKDLWMYGSALSGNSEWVKLATWEVPSPVTIQPVPPVDAVSVTPVSGAGTAQTFTLVFSDTAGVTDLTTAWFWITPTFNGTAANTCFGYYDRVAGQFKLLNDAGNLWSTATPGAAIAMQNSQCIFDGSIRAIAEGTKLTLVLPVRFGATFTGPKEIWTFAAGRTSSSDWKKLAAWTVSW